MHLKKKEMPCKIGMVLQIHGHFKFFHKYTFFFKIPVNLHTVHGVLKAKTLKWFAIPFSSGHVLSELSTMTRSSWVALHGMAHSFTELDKAMVHVISLVNFL